MQLLNGAVLNQSRQSGLLLWHRMGDFYELPFEDAVVASQALGIVLTKHQEDIPMCGAGGGRRHLQRIYTARGSASSSRTLPRRETRLEGCRPP